MYDIIIIGAGPAGMTAAIYARRADKKTLVLEASSYGGQIINALEVENYPAISNISGFDFATNLYEQAKNFGTDFIFEKAIEIKNKKKYKEVITTKNKYKAKAIIIATGANNRKLGIPNESEFLGKGVSYCATCDGAFYQNKVVAVQGGGNTAILDALYLADIAKVVYLIHRREEFRAEESLVKKLKEKENIKYVLDSTVTKLNGVEKLNCIEITNRNSEKEEIEVDGLFIAIGQVPETKNFSKLMDVDEAGYFQANENCHTNVDGIFVAGDTRSKSLRQLVTATCDGAISATEAIKYINNI